MVYYNESYGMEKRQNFIRAIEKHRVKITITMAQLV